MRQAGKADPTDGWDRVTPERLAGLGVDPALLDRRIRNRALRLARVSWKRGDKAAARGLEDVPGEGVAQVGDAQLFAGAAEVFAPEAVVLGPGVLVDIEVRKE